MKNIIELKNVSFSYSNGDYALENISFEIEKGAKAMIIGPNGSGKTTLLKIMVGLLNSSAGSLSILGERPKKVRSKIGYIPQKLDFDKTFPLTVLQFLQFSHSKIAIGTIKKELDNLGIKKLEKALIGQLSGGQLQRVLIVRALLGKPEILFLDEPVSGIDVGGEQNFYQLIDQAQDQYNATIVMVSHEINVVSSIATQVICINKKMLCSGMPEKTLSSNVMKELYGENVLPYKHNCQKND